MKWFPYIIHFKTGLKQRTCIELNPPSRCNFRLYIIIDWCRQGVCMEIRSNSLVSLESAISVLSFEEYTIAIRYVFWNIKTLNWMESALYEFWLNAQCSAADSILLSMIKQQISINYWNNLSSVPLTLYIIDRGIWHSCLFNAMLKLRNNSWSWDRLIFSMNGKGKGLQKSTLFSGSVTWL